MAARRPRKSDRGVKDFVSLLNAIKSIKIEKKSIRKASVAYELPLKSLARYIQKFDAEVPDISKESDQKLLEIVQRIASYANTSEAHAVSNAYSIHSFYFPIFSSNLLPLFIDFHEGAGKNTGRICDSLLPALLRP